MMSYRVHFVPGPLEHAIDFAAAAAEKASEGNSRSIMHLSAPQRPSNSSCTASINNSFGPDSTDLSSKRPRKVETTATVDTQRRVFVDSRLAILSDPADADETSCIDLSSKRPRKSGHRSVFADPSFRTSSVSSDNATNNTDRCLSHPRVSVEYMSMS